MSKIHLLGQLSEFGEVWETSETKVSSIFKLIECQQEGFKPFLAKALDAGLDLAIVSASGLEVEEPMEIFLNNLVQEDIYVSLIPAGSGKGWGKILAGVFIAIVSFYAGPAGGAAASSAVGTGGAAAGGGFAAFASNIGVSIGVSLALQGVTQLLTKVPGKDDEEDGPGIFNGPINTVKSGQPIPILYGELLIGGAPIHVNIAADITTGNSLPIPNVPSYGGPATGTVSGSTVGSGNSSPITQTSDETTTVEDYYHIITPNFEFEVGSIG